MQADHILRSIRIATTLVILTVIALMLSQGRAGGQAAAQTNAAAAQMKQVVVLDNAHVNVRHVTFPAGGYRQQLHSVGTAGDNRYDLMILLTPAQLEGQVDDKKVVSDKPGAFWEIPGAPSQHAFANLSNQPIEVMIVQVK
jgi:hypothetical protein